jgi:hypothetical protein
MIDRADLLADGKALVRSLVDDLRAATATDPDAAKIIEREYARASAAGRTALSRPEWAEGFYAQVAVAWVLGAVFVRFCEDNQLYDEPLLAGPGERRQIAIEQRGTYVAAHPAHDDRHWLRHIFETYAALPATGEILGPHNPVWILAPSADGAREVVQRFQALDPETGQLRHDFTDPAWNTRFLGDLYQDLSDHAKKTYALLQTPEFVEEFILDRALEPAVATFGLREVTLIDPTCGSGHFLLGAFQRLFDKWREAEPATGRRQHAALAVAAIGGVDLNPFAVAIARFRLLLAVMRASDYRRLADAPALPIHIAVGDSLLHGDPPGRLPGTSTDEEVRAAAAHGYTSENVEEARALLSREWHVVVGNPPYITVKDPALNGLYRKRFSTCRGKYSLGVPFTERFFQLARSDRDAERAGYVGMINANSFMKREMGKNLVEKWVPAHDLTHVIDTGGAYIPGYGIPTVILFGRNRQPVSPTVRAVMGIRGEPLRPDDPEKGVVWSSIVALVGEAGASNEYVSVVDLERVRLVRHPWSIGGGGAAELKELLDRRAAMRLGAVAESIGITSFTLQDDAFLMPANVITHRGLQPTRPMVEGDAIRDWVVGDLSLALFPYSSTYEPLREALPQASARWLWPNRCYLASNKMFGNKTKTEAGLHWTEYGRLTAAKLKTPLAITYAEVATHNHFVLDRGGKVFNRSAPVIKLPVGADERRHLQLVSVLNSSTACFWMQQVFHNKGGPGGGSSKDEKWHDFYEHDGTKLQQLPLPRELDASTAALLDLLATELSAATPLAVTEREVPTSERLAEAKACYADLRAQMIAAQERLDWEMYRRYGLVGEDLTTGDEPEPPLQLGERAFEIVLARRVAAGAVITRWFTKLDAVQITDLPSHWPGAYKRLVERRIELIETDLDIGLIERPEYKRRWAAKPWDEQVQVALRDWLLNRLESSRYWPEPAAITTTARLAAEAHADEDFLQVARLYDGRDDVDVAGLVAELVKGEAVPYLAAYRYSDAGLRKHAQWLEVWQLQRREDAGEDIGTIPVPPKYGKGDFQGIGWNHRGKLDVPKERFISYPGAGRETDPSMVVGWAGWDHLARARALATWYLQARRDGRDREHLVPLLAGLAELVPWLKQWYDAPNADPALDRPASQIAALLDAESRALHATADELAGWRPPAAARGRRRL